MVALTADFEFRPVGQGLFYTGTFKHKKSNFTMVYDCGVQPNNDYIKVQIDDFVAANKLGKSFDKKLDLLVISHFHNDHISHVGELLDKSGGAKYVMLPYLNENELFLATVDCHLTGGDSEVATFLSNPQGYLFEKGVDKIIYIHPDDSREYIPTDPPQTQANVTDDVSLELSINLRRNDEEVEADGRMEHYFDSGYLMICDYWVLRTFNQKRDIGIVESFIRRVKLDTILNEDGDNLVQLGEFFSKKRSEAIEYFKGLYESFFTKRLINDTSLLLLHGPLKAEAIESVYSSVCLRCCCPHEEHYTLIKDLPASTLLTGDIPLGVDVLEQLKRSMNAYLNRVVFFQIPHHGSRTYLAEKAFGELPNAQCCIVNFGLGNTYKHPSAAIIKMINDNGRKPLLNNQVEAVKVNYVFGGKST